MIFSEMSFLCRKIQENYELACPDKHCQTNKPTPQKAEHGSARIITTIQFTDLLTEEA